MASPTTAGKAFTAFYHGWLLNQEPIFHQLESSSSSVSAAVNDEHCSALVAAVMDHYQEYYTEKKKAAEEDVFVFFSSPWLSSFEQSFLWLSGLKPSTLFSAVDGGMLSEEQSCKMEMLRTETVKVEGVICNAMASVQETVAAAPVVGLLKTEAAGTVINGGNCSAALESLKLSVGRVMGSADDVLASTALKILEILEPKQAVKFLTAVMKFQREVRRWGLYKDSQRV
ncbi:unnamed protein product [Cuscuta europaea]|uniref:DOG1 domain-containing protein n=1 Tax=Cuscuta europaea TaxID=41803 RepID=A0A9P0YGL8_CUSEU|nr:unnamed protein product [Cuscuta europaea]